MNPEIAQAFMWQILAPDILTIIAIITAFTIAVGITTAFVSIVNH
jgi:hypothetical protein